MELNEYLEQLVKSTNMKCLTPKEVGVYMDGVTSYGAFCSTDCCLVALIGRLKVTTAIVKLCMFKICSHGLCAPTHMSPEFRNH